MAGKRLDRQSRGQIIRAATINQLVDGANWMSRFNVAPGFGMVSTAAGPVVYDARPRPLSVRLTSNASPYSFEQVFGDGAGGWATLSGGITGTNTAHEANGRDGLEDAVVYLEQVGADDWVFYVPMFVCSWVFNVNRCNGTAVQANAIVNIYANGDLGGSVIATCTTNVSGQCTVNVPAGTYDVRITPPASSGHATYTASGVAHTCSQTTNITLVPDSDHVCNPGFCPCDLMPEVLDLTFDLSAWTGFAFPDDTLTFVPSPGPGFPNAWVGASTFMAPVGIHGMTECQWRLECTSPGVMTLGAGSVDPTKPGSAFSDTLGFAPPDVCYPFSASESTTGPQGTIVWTLLE